MLDGREPSCPPRIAVIDAALSARPAPCLAGTARPAPGTAVPVEFEVAAAGAMPEAELIVGAEALDVFTPE